MGSDRNLDSFQLLCMSLLPARMKMMRSKMKWLEWSQHFSHYKSMGIFQNAQGQLRPQSVVGFGRISNLSVILWLSLLPARMTKDPIKNEGARAVTIFLHNNPMGAIC